MELSVIKTALTNAPFGALQPTLTAQEAEIRAVMLVEDMGTVGIDIQLRTFPVGDRLHVPYYEVPRTDFQQEGTAEKPVDDTLTAAGSGLNWGDLIRLSKACKIGRTLLGSSWPGKFKDKLLAEHNATVQELLWLGRFRNPKKIELEPRPFPGCKKRPDWRFAVDGQIINLEVKHRPGDWIRQVDGSQYSPARPGLFSDVSGKFLIKLEGELNLVALSVMPPLKKL